MSVTTLKRIALFTMVLNYVGALIPGMPVVFQWLGKLSAPLFFYCMAWSLEKTSDKKAYFKRLYIASVSLAAFNLLMSIVAQKTGLVTAVTTNVFATLFASAFLVDVIEYANRHPKRKLRIWCTYLFYQVSIAGVWAGLYEVVEVPYAVLNFGSAVLGSALTCEEGSDVCADGCSVLFYKGGQEQEENGSWLSGNLSGVLCEFCLWPLGKNIFLGGTRRAGSPDGDYDGTGALGSVLPTDFRSVPYVSQ